MQGERLSHLVCLEKMKLAAGVVLLSPFIPLIFMGEEYGETAPFPYFASHSDPIIIEVVRRGRQEEFAAFGWTDEPPDPQDEETFLRAKLNHHLRRKGHHRIILRLHRELLQIRKEILALAHLSKEDMDVLEYEREKVLVIRRWSGTDEALTVFQFGEASATISIPLPEGRWTKRLDSADKQWAGPGSQVPDEIISEAEIALYLSPYTFILFLREKAG